jgi:hypothetical protein
MEGFRPVASEGPRSGTRRPEDRGRGSRPSGGRKPTPRYPGRKEYPVTGRIPYDGLEAVASVVSAGETVLPGPGVKGRPVREGANPYATHPKSNTL